MRYALLICRDENAGAGTEPAQLTGFAARAEKLGDRLVGSTRLRLVATATTVRVRGAPGVSGRPWPEPVRRWASRLYWVPKVPSDA